jgi:hypothetical protein
MTTTVKVHGQLRCGTNYVTRVLRENFDVIVHESDDGGWKHGPMLGEATTAYLLMAKDPYSWLVSFRRWEEIHERAKPVGMATFLRGRVTHPRLRETWEASDPVDAWNRSYRSWLSRCEDLGACVVRYEDLVSRFEVAMKAIGSDLGVEPLHAELVNVTERVDTWATPRKRAPLDIESFVDGRSLEAFDADALDVVRDRIDADVVASLGYEVL